MRSQLPDAEHCKVVSALLLRALDTQCACGAFKLSAYPFCGQCREPIWRLGLWRDHQRVFRSMRDPLPENFDWLSYELVTDTLHAFRTGLYNPKARPNSLEEGGA